MGLGWQNHIDSVLASFIFHEFGAVTPKALQPVGARKSATGNELGRQYCPGRW